MTAARKTKVPAALRAGDPLRVGREEVTFGRNILPKNGTVYELQHRLFVNDPWELMAEAVARAVVPGKASPDLCRKKRPNGLFACRKSPSQRSLQAVTLIGNCSRPSNQQSPAH